MPENAHYNLALKIAENIVGLPEEGQSPESYASKFIAAYKKAVIAIYCEYDPSGMLQTVNDKRAQLGLPPLPFVQVSE